eukprot:261790_1
MEQHTPIPSPMTITQHSSPHSIHLNDGKGGHGILKNGTMFYFPTNNSNLTAPFNNNNNINGNNNSNNNNNNNNNNNSIDIDNIINNKKQILNKKLSSAIKTKDTLKNIGDDIEKCLSSNSSNFT